jgi:hypothetical protein
LNAAQNSSKLFFLNYERTGTVVILNLRFFKTNLHATRWQRPKL